MPSFLTMARRRRLKEGMRARVLRKLGIRPAGEGSFRILLSSLKTLLEYADGLESLARWDAPVLPNLRKLGPEELRFIEYGLRGEVPSIREAQRAVQYLMPRRSRKRFAAYYTVEEGAGLMASIVREFLRSRGGEVVIADPFLGSGYALSAAVKAVGAERVRWVWGIEPLPLPALVAYASLINLMGGRREAVTVIVGDAFTEVPRNPLQPPGREPLKADIIVTNPPFTRWKYLEEGYRRYLLSAMARLGYRRYVTRRGPGLQTLSMLLCDHALREGGLLVSVLPASTFYTIYGRGYKALLRERYGVYALIEPKHRPSFSEDSEFREVIIAAVKGSGRRLTAFVELGDDPEGVAEAVMGEEPAPGDAVDIRSLPRFLDTNWLALFGGGELRSLITEVIEQGLRSGSLGYWGEVLGRGRMVRGVEIYGPDFFFLPNRYWRIVEDGEGFVRVRGEGRELIIDKGFLVKALRKPSLYGSRLVAEANTYMLSIPPLKAGELPPGLREYIDWGAVSGTALPAMRAYGRHWYSHVHRQVRFKKPFGRVFVPDKVDVLFRGRGVYANYAEESVAASKNFYIIKGVGTHLAKALTGWFNSTIFLSILTLLGRRISTYWTRLLKSDYLELPVINPANPGEDGAASEVVEAVNTMMREDLPPIWEQLREEYRKDLDTAVARFIGVENPERTIKKLYAQLEARLGRVR